MQGRGRDFASTRSRLAENWHVEALRRARRRGLPNLKRFLERIHERPAYKRAIEKGGKVEILGLVDVALVPYRRHCERQAVKTLEIWSIVCATINNREPT